MIELVFTSSLLSGFNICSHMMAVKHQEWTAGGKREKKLHLSLKVEKRRKRRRRGLECIHNVCDQSDGNSGGRCIIAEAVMLMMTQTLNRQRGGASCQSIHRHREEESMITWS